MERTYENLAVAEVERQLETILDSIEMTRKDSETDFMKAVYRESGTEKMALFTVSPVFGIIMIRKNIDVTVGKNGKNDYRLWYTEETYEPEVWNIDDVKEAYFNTENWEDISLNEYIELINARQNGIFEEI